MVVDLEQGGLVGGLAHWAVNPSRLDTLCCPIETEAKILALAQMYRNYEKSDHVSVLDKSLQMQSLEALDNCYLSASIYVWKIRR